MILKYGTMPGDRLARFLKSRDEGRHGPLKAHWVGRRRWILVLVRDNK